VGGKLGRHPRLARELPGIHHLEEALKVVDQFLDHYQRYCLKGERFGEILERTGIIELRGKKEELLETGKGS
jgi:dissimilatory sulfite reductase (desulfoviridin) alpha/beta subunit